MKRKTFQGFIAVAGITLCASVLANPYPYHSGKVNVSDDDVITTTTKSKYSYSDDDTTTINKSFSDDDTTTVSKSYSDDDVTNTTTKSKYSYSDDDVTKISKSYSDDDVTKVNKSWESNYSSSYSSDWRNHEEGNSSAVQANDLTRQDVGHKASANVSGAAAGHSNETHGANTYMNFGGLGNPVSNTGLYIDNTDQNNNQFGINSNQSSLQAGGDYGDRVISVSGVGNTDGSAMGSVGTYGSNDLGQYGDNGLTNSKSVSSAGRQ